MFCVCIPAYCNKLINIIDNIFPACCVKHVIEFFKIFQNTVLLKQPHSISTTQFLLGAVCFKTEHLKFKRFTHNLYLRQYQPSLSFLIEEVGKHQCTILPHLCFFIFEK